LLSGAEVATQRSFFMTAVVLIAVMVDRRAITFRTLAVAAMIVLAIAPEALVHPSFPELGGLTPNPVTGANKTPVNKGLLLFPSFVSLAQKLNKTAENTGFGGKESRNKSRNDSAVREPFYINSALPREERQQTA